MRRPIPRPASPPDALASRALPTAWPMALLLALLMVCPTARVAAQGDPVPRPRAVANVSGVVFDSVAMRALPGAVVQLVEAGELTKAVSAIADSAGRFVFDSVGAGRYLLGFTHARLDSIGATSPVVQVLVTSGDTLGVPVRAVLTTPARVSVLRSHCGNERRIDEVSVFRGIVRRAADASPVVGASVRVQWHEIEVGRLSVQRRTPSAVVRTDADGAFVVCQIPAGARFVARAFEGRDTTGYVELELPGDGILRRDLILGRAERVASSGIPDSLMAALDSSSRFTSLRGNGALRVDVRGRGGAPLAGARLAVWGSASSATTSENGIAALDALPSGTQTLEVRALGYQRRQLVVDIPENVEGSVSVTLDPMAVALDTMRVRGVQTLLDRRMAAFEQRRKSAPGFFATQAEIARQFNITLSDVVRRHPGVRQVYGKSKGYITLFKGIGGLCVPNVFLNGMLTPVLDGVIDDIIVPDMIRAIEIYPSWQSVPSEFYSPRQCGVIAIWT